MGFLEYTVDLAIGRPFQSELLYGSVHGRDGKSVTVGRVQWKISFLEVTLNSLSSYNNNIDLISFQSRVPVILSHWGSGTSFKNFVHFGQVRWGRFYLLWNLCSYVNAKFGWSLLRKLANWRLLRPLLVVTKLDHIIRALIICVVGLHEAM